MFSRPTVHNALQTPGLQSLFSSNCALNYVVHICCVKFILLLPSSHPEVMRKSGCMYFVAEISVPVLSEVWVYLSMCCGGTGSNTVVCPMLKAGVAGRSSAPLGECSSH